MSTGSCGVFVRSSKEMIVTRPSTIALVTAMTAAQIFAQKPTAKTSAGARAVLHTPDGHPDLQGVWTNATLTPLERPASFAGKLNLTDAEAAVFEKAQDDELKAGDGKSEGEFHRRAGSGDTGGYNALFIDRGSELERVDGVKRSSLIIDPPDGKVPPLTTEARQRLSSLRRGMRADSPRDRALSERCLMSFGSSSGPPMLPVLYNNNYQIVQTPGAVMILVEMIHDVRIIRMNSTHPADNVRLWLGDSIGHWDGDTLVVDTTNFNDQVIFRGSSKNLHVIERFTRTSGDTMLYRATIDDPTTFSKNWTVEYPFTQTKGPVFEYACHEGNYALVDILTVRV
jgi:hypothetical protein